MKLWLLTWKHIDRWMIIRARNETIARNVAAAEENDSSILFGGMVNAEEISVDGESEIIASIGIFRYEATTHL